MERFDVAAEIIQEAGKILRRCHLEQTEQKSARRRATRILSPFGIAKSNSSSAIRS